MAYCENCGSKGHDPRQMVAVKKDNNFILAGPCCTVPEAQPVERDVEYGLEISSHYGLVAYAKYEGLKVEYRRTPDQLAAWFGVSPPQQIQNEVVDAQTQH